MAALRYKFDSPVVQSQRRDLSSSFGGGMYYTGHLNKCERIDHLRVQGVISGQQEGVFPACASHCNVQKGRNATLGH